MSSCCGARIRRFARRFDRDTWFEAEAPSHVHLGPHFLATSSLTKAYGLSGLRCGWVLAAEDLVEVPRHFRLGFAIRTEDVARGLENLGRVLREG